MKWTIYSRADLDRLAREHFEALRSNARPVADRGVKFKGWSLWVGEGGARLIVEWVAPTGEHSDKIAI